MDMMDVMDVYTAYTTHIFSFISFYKQDEEGYSKDDSSTLNMTERIKKYKRQEFYNFMGISDPSNASWYCLKNLLVAVLS